MTSRTNQQAYGVEVVEVESLSFSRTIPCTEDTPYEPINPRKVKRMKGDLAWLQEVAWDFTNGIRGPRTLKKCVEVTDTVCPECGTVGRYDEFSEIICDDPECGVVISESVYVAPEDGFTGRTGGTNGAALNDPVVTSNEPNKL